jgi:fatty acid desaturase
MIVRLSNDEKYTISLRDNLIPAVDLLLRVAMHLALYMAMSYNLYNLNYLNLVLFAYINSITWHFWGYAGIAHELHHGTVFFSKKANRILFFVCSYLTWNNPYYFSVSHRIHHRNIFSQGDVEIYKVLPKPVILFVRFVVFDYVGFAKQIVYVVTNLLGWQIHFKGCFFGISVIRADRWIVAFHAAMILLVNVGLSWVLFFVTGSWVLAIIFLITPFAGKFLNAIFAIAQHIGLEGSREKGWLYNSRTIILPAPLGFLYANMNYHAEHHLFPYVPYYRLPALNILLKEKGVDRLPEVNLLFLISKYFRIHLIKLYSQK